jgi:DNA-binding SARP family transcriptional activator
MHIYVLGPTRVVTPSGTVGISDFGGVKPRQILEILAVSAGTPVSKECLADQLWDGHPPKSYLGTLESYVCVLRRSLGLGGGRGAGVITVPQGYLLDSDVHAVDLTSFRSLVHRARAAHGDPESSLALLEQALELVQGDLLADETYAAWAIEERGRFQAEVVAAASLAASQALALGRPEEACRWAHTALAHDRLAEHVWRILMQALHASGRRSEALRAYFEVRDLLAAELGADPSRETTDVYLDLLRGDVPTTKAAATRVHDEIELLMRLLRQAMSSVPETEVPRRDLALMQFASDLLAAS